MIILNTRTTPVAVVRPNTKVWGQQGLDLGTSGSWAASMMAGVLVTFSLVASPLPTDGIFALAALPAYAI